MEFYQIVLVGLILLIVFCSVVGPLLPKANEANKKIDKKFKELHEKYEHRYL